MLQLAHPKVAQSKPGAIRSQVCLCWTMSASVNANSKLRLSASTPKQGIFVSASHQTGLLKGLEDFDVGGRVETIQTTALLRMTRIQRRVLET